MAALTVDFTKPGLHPFFEIPEFSGIMEANRSQNGRVIQRYPPPPVAAHFYNEEFKEVPLFTVIKDPFHSRFRTTEPHTGVRAVVLGGDPKAGADR
ncbi:hypothetical protein ILYODFUR_012336 [Ilyodon furcidens]|uniref:Uncharacterized protein n=1 Tax=Ilyodon furcidens TaxID=33524 RepID=A0ABV0UFK8_9TELE